jgi:NAD(P)-dependent dehydrogenase (short-subunit alcohol dehydrogenase family)
MGVLEGKVVLVSGGGRGIGRECALLAAREGAKVMVNDFGGTLAGTTSAETPARDVVQEIARTGGIAVANEGSVTSTGDVRQMIEQSLDTFGGLHAIINPAGILRDRMFHKMSEEEWDSVIQTHLRGAFNMARASIEHFRKQEHGAYVLFTSTTGLIGNIAQANYAAAKLGVVGLSRSIAMENAAKNVRSNIIAPFAYTRMVSSIPITDEAAAQRVERFKTGMRAEQVAQLAVALCASGANVPTGQIFGVRGNELILFSQPRPIRTLALLEGWTPQSILQTALPAFESGFTDLAPSAAVFPYEPL